MTRRTLATALSAALLIAGPVAVASSGHGDPPGRATDVGTLQLDDAESALVRLELPDRAVLEQLLRDDADIAAIPAASPEARGDRVLVDLVLTGEELAQLESQGATVLQVIQREGDGTRHFEASREAAARQHEAGLTRTAGSAVPQDTLTFDHAYWWTSGGQTFVQVQVSTTAGTDPALQITVDWESADGTTGSFPLVRYVDAGQYLFHYHQPAPLPDTPVTLTATSNQGGTATAEPVSWPGSEPPPLPSGYQQDFIDAYLTPSEINERIDRLAEQYPDLVDVIELPHQTHGYNRTAKAYLGDPAATAIVVESVASGASGMNGTEVRVVDPGAPDQALSGEYADGTLTVSLATDAAGQVSSTTEEVTAYLNEQFSGTFGAFVLDGAEGQPMPLAEAVLDDGLEAPHLSPDGAMVRALRIGVHRDGSRPGVYTYSQEHAREWVTPLVTMEFAERMLANHATDEETARLLEEVEIFVLPVVNPDGANYSFNDYNFQRKNLSEHCEGVNREPAWEDNWGVDVNRNYAVGSVWDGYVGGSLNCLSGSFAGTGELSEAESQNVTFVAEQFPNITHAINVHSYGGYFMWSPGAYQADGRVPLPLPEPEVAEDFMVAAQRIVGAIAGHRGTVTWPSKTGPVVDVLYSAAGNSGDHLFYEHDIYAWDFEVGNDLWNEATQQWEGVGFQPPFEEAHPESQEYAAGLVELVRVAADDAPVHRLSGVNRYATSVAIGQEAFPESQTAVLVSGAEVGLVDGLVAGPLGRHLEAPVLLTRPDQLPAVVAQDLSDRGVTEVVVVGGEGAVNEAVVDTLTGLGIDSERVSGSDRFATAAAVAERLGAGDDVIVSSGEAGHLVDALAVSGPAAATGTPVLLVRQDRVPNATAQALEGYSSAVAVGGAGAISDDVLAELPNAERLAGADRWRTATTIADHYVGEGLDATSVAVSSGADAHLVDALPGGTLGEVVLLSRPGELPSATTAWLAASADTEHVWVLGGVTAVADTVMDTLRAMLAPWAE
ncbi:cell wall-binding repeat-containing protein [Ornithinimicrobium sp. F0845]|uniref:cell wall-binding repeat-containing protein n=1 Tax=Ornithinimicrobium sp. F0845 TaxID=2926412 RepID=UPI001FF28168|nr:cell wall-binding repeat-containing protein [Ornithinimicrobium sp. F0845]MCK0112626.1 cell wall-binding repeat-containing protein [Ornithinimicrobium sp. F0845]